MLLRMLISCLALIFSVAALAQNSDAQGPPAAAVLVCPPANQPVQDPATFTWKEGVKTPNYRLLLGPAAGSSSDGDSSLITGLKGQLSGLPPGANLYVTLWSYDQAGNTVQPPSSCAIRTAQSRPEIGFNDVPGTTLSGVSLGSFSVNGAADTSLVANPIAVAAKACQSQCRQNAGCQGYTYYPAGNGNPAAMCDLKSQITATEPNECCLSALKTVSATAAAPVSAVPAPAPAPTATTPAAPRTPAPAPRTTRAQLPSLASSSPSPAPSTGRAPAPAPARSTAPAAGLITGDWVNQFGAITRLVQQGNAVSGTYSDAKQPKLTGTLQGTFDGKTLRATLNWKSGDDNSYGSLLLTLTAQGNLEGTWTDATGVSGPWGMERPSIGAR